MKQEVVISLAAFQLPLSTTHRTAPKPTFVAVNSIERFKAPPTHLQYFIYPDGHTAPPLVLRPAKGRDVCTV